MKILNGMLAMVQDLTLHWRFSHTFSPPKIGCDILCHNIELTNGKGISGYFGWSGKA